MLTTTQFPRMMCTMMLHNIWDGDKSRLAMISAFARSIMMTARMLRMVLVVTRNTPMLCIMWTSDHDEGENYAELKMHVNATVFATM